MRYLLLLLFFISGSIFSQTLEENINLPNNDSGGSLVADILMANDKLFAYSADGISIYDASDNSFEKKIFFTETLGKFNPVYHDPRLYSPEQSIMVYNNHDTYNKYVYALTPKLDLLIINTDNLDQTWTVQLQVEEFGDDLYLKDHLDSQSGRVILKYDNNNGHERLYLLINSRDNEGTGNSTGGFHEQRIIFAIYKVDYNVPLNDASVINLHYSEINKAASGTYELQINNYVFNETNDFLYIVRLGTRLPSSIAKIEVREFTESSTVFVQDFDFENIGTSASGYHKMGKMLYIHDVNTSPNIHKVVIFPYRYFQGDIPSPRFCVIDIHENNTHSISYIDSPSKRILDAVYLEDNQDIIISYAPDNNQIPNEDYTNIAIFHYDLSSNGIALTQYFDNDNSTNTSNLDINSSFFLTKLDGSSILISKKDGIDKLEWDNTLQEPAYVYSEDGLLNAENNFFMEGIREGSYTYINNLVSNGIEIYDNSNNVFQNSLRTGYPVYHIIANNDGSRQIYYNKLESHKTGFYCYSYIHADDLTPAEEIYVNINDDNYTNNDIETAIGDIVYNPFQDHFLITKFKKESAEIMIIKGSDYSYSDIVLELENDLPGTQFATEMFISPNGLLYIWANMNNDENKEPTIFIYNAKNYNYLTNVVVDENFNFSKSYTN